MANYPTPDHPLTDRQQTAWVSVYESAVDTAPTELQDALAQFEQIITNKILDSLTTYRLRDTHIGTARKYAKAWMATLLEQGYLNELVSHAANVTDSLADSGQKRNETATVGL